MEKAEDLGEEYRKMREKFISDRSQWYEQWDKLCREIEILEFERNNLGENSLMNKIELDWTQEWNKA